MDNKEKSKFPHEVIRDSIETKKDEPIFFRETVIKNLGIDEEDMILILEEDETGE